MMLINKLFINNKIWLKLDVNILKIINTNVIIKIFILMIFINLFKIIKIIQFMKC
jgi:hypothetical protein